MKVFLGIAQKIVEQFMNSREVKEFVIHLLDRYVKTTDNDIDDMVVVMVRKALLREWWNALLETLLLVFIILLGISELMARSKKIKENSIHQWITNKLRLIVRGG